MLKKYLAWELVKSVKNLKPKSSKKRSRRAALKIYKSTALYDDKHLLMPPRETTSVCFPAATRIYIKIIFAAAMRDDCSTQAVETFPTFSLANINMTKNVLDSVSRSNKRRRLELDIYFHTGMFCLMGEKCCSVFD